MTETPNFKREAELRLSRIYKDLFGMIPVPRSWLLRMLFLDADGRSMRRAGTAALRHLRYYCFADRSVIGGTAGTTDNAYLLGVREGRRQVYLTITKSLNLDEDAVRKILENDDDY